VKLADKVAIVTGTSPNIGGGIAEGLAAEGARVVCVDVAADNATQCAAAITARGGQALGLACDVTDERQVEAMVARAREAYGRVDVLVNNAGILGGQSVLDMPLERWTRRAPDRLTPALRAAPAVGAARLREIDRAEPANRILDAARPDLDPDLAQHAAEGHDVPDDRRALHAASSGWRSRGPLR